MPRRGRRTRNDAPEPIRVDDVDTGWVPATRPAFGAIGLAAGAEHLSVAGGMTAEIVRVDIATSDTEATLATPEAEATFLNDLTVAPNGDVYVTDSNLPVLFRVPAGADKVEARPASWMTSA